MFTKAIVRTPAGSVVNGISSSNLGKPNFELLLRQYDEYIRALEKCGLELIVLPALEQYPDSVFIEDVAIVTPFFAVICNPGTASRKGETEGIAEALAPYFLSIDTISETGTLEGGDVMQVGEHFFIGVSDRTNLNGAFQLISILKKNMLTGTTINVKDILHLKTGVSYLEEGNLLVGNELAYHPTFEEFNRLPVDKIEAYAANSLWINDKVIVPKGYSNTRKMIETEGYETIEIDVSEFQKLDGGLSCLSLRF